MLSKEQNRVIYQVYIQLNLHIVLFPVSFVPFMPAINAEVLFYSKKDPEAHGADSMSRAFSLYNG